MGSDAFGHSGAPVDRRADERMAERRSAVGQAHQLRGFGGLKILEPQTNPISSVQHHTEFAGALGRRDQQRQPVRRWQPVDLGTEGIQQPAAGGQPWLHPPPRVRS